MKSILWIFRSVKSDILTCLEALNFGFFIFALFEGLIFQNEQNSAPLKAKTAKTDSFRTPRIPTLISRKFWESEKS